MYVWVDALTTYLSGLGYPDPASDFGKFWPADIHMIGKDIVRIHTVYWPAFLMSAGLPLPKQVFGYGFLLHRRAKMSSTHGNVVVPLDLAEPYLGRAWRGARACPYLCISVGAVSSITKNRNLLL